MARRQIPEYLTFDDVLMKPGASSVLPAEVQTRTHIARDIALNHADPVGGDGHGDGRPASPSPWRRPAAWASSISNLEPHRAGRSKCGR
jgi:hypothetical protein